MEKPGKKGAQLQVYHVLIFKYQHPNVFLMAVVSTAESSIQYVQVLDHRTGKRFVVCAFSILHDDLVIHGVDHHT